MRSCLSAMHDDERKLLLQLAQLSGLSERGKNSRLEILQAAVGELAKRKAASAPCDEQVTTLQWLSAHLLLTAAVVMLSLQAVSADRRWCAP